MSDIIEYKCPACAGKLEFDSGAQKMKCPFCESEFDVESLKDHDTALENTKPDEMNWDTTAGSDWQDGETEGMRIYTCKSCGGEIITDSTTAASKCPYCDNPVVMSGNFSGDLKPDYVIPFKFDKEAAKKALNKHLEGRKLLPKVFKDQNHIDEIKGLYVPVWLFDAEADGSMLYKAEKIRRWSDNNFNYIERKYYSVKREGNVAFELVPVDGSTKMQDELMESIEPFNFKDAVDFQTAYLSGYLADRYDVSAEDSVARANERIKKTTQQIFDSTVQGYDSFTRESGNIKLSNGKAKYALYPVWLLNTTWNGNKYTFAMNGQTGKFVGDLPVDSGAAIKWFFAIAAGVTAVCFGLSFLLGL
jgi:DNA-directed RNA polymerase subunit RPC12/RpoP